MYPTDRYADWYLDPMTDLILQDTESVFLQKAIYFKHAMRKHDTLDELFGDSSGGSGYARLGLAASLSSHGSRVYRIGKMF